MDTEPDSLSGTTPAPRPRWRLLAIGCACVLAALLVDAPVAGWLSSDPVRHWLTRLTGLSAAAPYLITLAILAAYPNRRRLYVGFLVPVLVSAGVLHGLKWAIGRGRPLLDKGPFQFSPFAGEHPWNSFPSGDALAAGVLTLLLGIYFPRARWVFYTLAGLVGLERIITRMHYPSDVLAGYVLAGVVVFSCLRLLGPTFYQKEPTPSRGAGSRC
jgi:membrane-associated phospholipid phosphatase